jgi:hypothetical protein
MNRKFRRRNLAGLTFAVALFFVGALLPSSALGYSYFANTPNDWAPCNGFNQWNTVLTGTISLATGYFNAFGNDQANSQAACSPDTTEHEVSLGIYGGASSYFNPGSGTHTVYTYFDGQVSIYGYSGGTGCAGGFGHATFTVAAWVYDHTNGLYLKGAPSTVSTISVSCWSNYHDVGLYTYYGSVTGTFTSGHVYEPIWVIDALDGSSMNYNSGGGSAQAAANYWGSCFTYGGTSTPININGYSYV